MGLFLRLCSRNAWERPQCSRVVHPRVVRTRAFDVYRALPSGFVVLGQDLMVLTLKELLKVRLSFDFILFVLPLSLFFVFVLF